MMRFHLTVYGYLLSVSSYSHELKTTSYAKKNCDVLRDLVPFVQFKKREKHPWRSVTFSEVAGIQPTTLLKVILLHGCF